MLLNVYIHYWRLFCFVRSIFQSRYLGSWGLFALAFDYLPHTYFMGKSWQIWLNFLSVFWEVLLNVHIYGYFVLYSRYYLHIRTFEKANSLGLSVIKKLLQVRKNLPSTFMFWLFFWTLCYFVTVERKQTSLYPLEHSMACSCWDGLLDLLVRAEDQTCFSNLV